MKIINKELIIETLNNKLSHEFKQWYPMERLNNWELENINIDLLTLAGIIVHPPKDNPNVRNAFIEDAKFICEYSQSLEFDEYTKMEFRNLLSEIYIFIRTR